MPHEYAYRLELREEQSRMAYNQPGPEADAAFRRLLGD
jgi:hypothetical protein